jgi:hypothetical protein
MAGLFRQSRTGCCSPADEWPLWNGSFPAYQGKQIVMCFWGMLPRLVLPVQELAAKMKMAAAQGSFLASAIGVTALPW